MTEEGESKRRENEAEYELVLAGPGLTVKRQVPESLALRVLSVVMGGTPSVERHGPGAATAITRIDPTISLSEFIGQSGAKNIPDKIAAIGLYLSEQSGQETFTRDDVRSQFQIAGEPVPRNLPRDFSLAVSNRWLAPTNENQRDFYITGTGKKAVKEGFPAELRKPARPVRRTRRRKAEKS